MPYSIDLRERVISAVDGGMKKVDVAKAFKVCRRVIYNWLALRQRTNSLEAKSGYQKGHSHKVTDWDEFRKFAEANRYCSVKKMTVEWEKTFNTTISETAMEDALKKINFTSKKKHLTISKLTKKNVHNF